LNAPSAASREQRMQKRLANNSLVLDAADSLRFLASNSRRLLPPISFVWRKGGGRNEKNIPPYSKNNYHHSWRNSWMLIDAMFQKDKSKLGHYPALG
jgi:hypothetical protein